MSRLANYFLLLTGAFGSSQQHHFGASMDSYQTATDTRSTRSMDFAPRSRHEPQQQWNHFTQNQGLRHNQQRGFDSDTALTGLGTGLSIEQMLKLLTTSTTGARREEISSTIVPKLIEMMKRQQ